MFHRLAPFAVALVQHRDLLVQFAVRNVELRHRGSHLGLIWSFLNPLLMLGLYVLVFGFIFSGSFRPGSAETKLEYGLGIFVGLTLYHFFAEILGTAPSIIVSNPNFVKKVVFPLDVLPAAAVGAALFHLLVSLGLALAGVALFGPGMQTSWAWLPFILLPLVILGLGTAWLLSALGVFFRDIGQITQFLSVALMWASAVFFSAQQYPEAWEYLRFNPLLLAISLARDVVLWNRPLNFTHLGYLYLSSLALCYFGHAAFRRMKPAFADVI